jgi:hypothetical protein
MTQLLVTNVDNLAVMESFPQAIERTKKGMQSARFCEKRNALKV